MLRSVNCAAAGNVDRSVMATPAANANFNVFTVVSSRLVLIVSQLTGPAAMTAAP
jgi:hypothetical protein